MEPAVRRGGPFSQAGRRVALGPAGEVLFIGDFGGAVDFGGGAAADSAGGLVIAGFFGGALDFGGGPLACDEPSDIFVARFAP